MNEKSEDTSALVPFEAKQVEDARPIWSWVEPTIWTPRMLATLESGVKGGKWYSLSDKAFSIRSLHSAFAKVKSRGGACGVDGITIARFERQLESELDRLSRSLLGGTYRPQSVRRVWIPKPGSREKRPLGIPTVRDRVVQSAIRHALEPIFEQEFCDSSYGFRPGRSCGKALKRVWLKVKKGNSYVVDADLKRFFDTIPHERIMSGLEEKVSDGKLLDVVKAFLRQGVMEWGSSAFDDSEEGTPQGSVISPLLANIALHGMDLQLEAEGYELVRYADDFVVLCSSRHEAESAMESVQDWVFKAGLELHPEKTRIVEHLSGESFEFLGYKFLGHRVYPRRKSQKKFRDKVRELTPRTSGDSLKAILSKLNPVLRGWYRYFRHSWPTAFTDADKFVRRRLRSILGRRLGKRRFAGGTDNNRWPNAFFVEQGLFTMQQAHASRQALFEANR